MRIPNSSLACTWDFETTEAGELSVRQGERLTLLSAADENGWVRVQSTHGKVGLVPANRVRALKERNADAGVENIGHVRADPAWGYNHGVPFANLHPSHPLYLEAAMEEFSHNLLFNGK